MQMSSVLRSFGKNRTWKKQNRIFLIRKAQIKRRQFFSTDNKMSESVNIGELVSVSIDAALQAGHITMQNFNLTKKNFCEPILQRLGDIIRNVWKSGNLETKQKGYDDPFTIAGWQKTQFNQSKLLLTFN